MGLHCKEYPEIRPTCLGNYHNQTSVAHILKKKVGHDIVIQKSKNMCRQKQRQEPKRRSYFDENSTNSP